MSAARLRLGTFALALALAAGCATSAYQRAGSSEDVADGLRVDVVRTIGHLSGAAATTALVEYIASVPAKDDRPSKKEAQKLIDEKGPSK